MSSAERPLDDKWHDLAHRIERRGQGQRFTVDVVAMEPYDLDTNVRFDLRVQKEKRTVYSTSVSITERSLDHEGSDAVTEKVMRLVTAGYRQAMSP